MKRNSVKAVMMTAIAATLSVGFVNITPKVIYGEDGRKEVYQVPSAQVREIADSTVALIPAGYIDPAGNGMVTIFGRSVGETMRLCKSEAFFTQPSSANCSGALVGEDLVMTAGHCVRANDCSRYAYVFGYRMLNSSDAAMTLPESEVYQCKEVVAWEYTSEQDYALIRLNRPVKGHRPLAISQGATVPGDEIYVVGHPSGLPTKITSGAHVRTHQGSYFVTNLDTYGGNSGSAVFSATTNEIVGILVRGENDYNMDYTNKCYVSNRCADNACRGEDVTDISYIREALKSL